MTGETCNIVLPLLVRPVHTIHFASGESQRLLLALRATLSSVLVTALAKLSMLVL